MADVKNPDTRPVNEQRGLEAENAVLGSLLIDPEIAPELFAAVKPEDFQFKENRLIFSTARALFRDDRPFDAVIVRGELGVPESETEHYSEHLYSLLNNAVTSANWKEYAAIMREQTALANIHALGAALSFANTLDECRPLAVQLTDALEQRRNVRVKSLAELLTDFLDYQGECAENPRNEYVSYGFPELDAGMFTQVGDVVVIGGYPSDGKTAFSLPLAYTIANAPRKDGENHKVGYFSLETDFAKLRDRMMTHLSQIDFSRIKFHRLSDRDWETLASVTVSVSRTPAGNGKNPALHFIESADMTVSDITSISRAYGFDVIFIDYVQSITPETARNATRSEEVAAISRRLHAFAQKTKTLVFELSQLTRPEPSSGGGKPARNPRMNNLKESGQLEQDADAIFILFRPDPDKERRILRIAKNKEGRLGSWFLDFDASTQTFRMSANQASENVMRDLSDAGRAAKQYNRAKGPLQLQLDAAGPLDDLPF